MDCIFCKIVAGEVPGDFVYRDEDVAAFRDVNPVAPTHVLIVPTKHIPSLVRRRSLRAARSQQRRGKRCGYARRAASPGCHAGRGA